MGFYHLEIAGSIAESSLMAGWIICLWAQEEMMEVNLTAVRLPEDSRPGVHRAVTDMAVH